MTRGLCLPTPLALGCAALLALPPAALAQGLPGAALPGQIEQQLRRPPEPRGVPGEVTIPAAADRVGDEAAEAVRFRLSGIALEGVTVYPPEALHPYYLPYLRAEVSLATLQRMAAAITARYRNDGYLLTQVLVPEQRVPDGVVTLRVIEGFVDKTTVSADPAGSGQGLPEAYAARIAADRPLTARVLERYLLLTNDLPGAAARGTLYPAPAVAGAADLQVDYSERRFGLGLAVDNRGSRALGRTRYSADVEFNDVLGRHERTGLRYLGSGDDRLKLLSLSHEQPLGSDGTRLGLTATAVQARPDTASPLPLDLQTDSRSLGLSLSHPLLRSRATNLYLRASLTGHNGASDLLGFRNSEDRVRALRLGLAWDHADRWRGINLVDVEFSQGLNGLGALRSGDPLASRIGGRSDFSKLNLYAARLQSLAGRWSVLAAFQAQHAFTTLLAPELFGYGGELFGRGFEPSELVGDSGAAVKLELRYTRPAEQADRTGLTAYAFWDGGTVRRKNPQGEPTAQTATSTGLGLRFGFNRYVTGYVEVAKPLNRTPLAEGNRDPQGYFGVSARY